MTLKYIKDILIFAIASIIPFGWVAYFLAYYK